MPLSMITNYKEITVTELGVLERQFEKSYFIQHHPNNQPKKLAIFDFDSTLFFSPLLSPTLWHPNLIGVATAESVYGPGWWRDIRSLDLGPFDQLQKTAWQGYWNEKIVKDARRCIHDPNTMTVVLTGRRYHPFHHLIPAMLEAKGLQFDLIGLRPDPEVVSENHWEANHHAEISYNLTGSVFKSTMHFKTCFILNILHNIPSIKNVVMWDDRFHHVKRFREYLETVKTVGTIEQGSVIYVPGIRPKYNPEWEKNVIGHIIDTHNKALLEHIQEGKKNGKIAERLEWNKLETEDPLASGSQNFLQLAPLPAQTVIALSAENIDQLKTAYKSVFSAQLKKNNRKWKNFGGEESMFFGDHVYISQNTIPSASIAIGPIGTQVNITIIAHSVSPRIQSLLLQVQVEGDNENKYILPLWYKPSEFNDIFRLKDDDIQWRIIRPNDRNLTMIRVQGKVNYAYRLGVVEKPYRKRTNEDDLNDTNPKSRLRN